MCSYMYSVLAGKVLYIYILKFYMYIIFKKYSKDNAPDLFICHTAHVINNYGYP